MKIIKYNLKVQLNIGTELYPIWEDTPGPECTMPYNEANLSLAEAEAYGEVTIEDDGQPESEDSISIEDTILDLVADHEYRLCMLELGGEEV